MPEYEKNEDGTFKIVDGKPVAETENGIIKMNHDPISWEDLREKLSYTDKSYETDQKVANFLLDRQYEDQEAQIQGSIAQSKSFLRNAESDLERAKQSGNTGGVQAAQEQLNSYHNSIASAEKQKHELKNKRGKFVSLEEESRIRTGTSTAELGYYAYQKQMERAKAGDPMKKDLYVAPENIEPGQYGGHPDELLDIVKESRKQLAHQFVKKENMSQSDAEAQAAKHVKATFDVAHANTWRKYYQGDSEGFDNWMVEKMEMLDKAGVLGHIHISDNEGHEDDHLNPGEGNVPLRRMLKKIKDKGYDMVVETGPQDFDAYASAMNEIGMPLDASFAPVKTNDPWNVINNSYFNGAPAYFVSPQYGQQFNASPSLKEGFTSWAGVPFD